MSPRVGAFALAAVAILTGCERLKPITSLVSSGPQMTKHTIQVGKLEYNGNEINVPFTEIDANTKQAKSGSNPSVVSISNIPLDEGKIYTVCWKPSTTTPQAVSVGSGVEGTSMPTPCP
jgi:hypothetical protein